MMTPLHVSKTDVSVIRLKQLSNSFFVEIGKNDK